MGKIDRAVEEAKKHLKKPRDITHDIAHHRKVWENCERIIKSEDLNVNSGLVKVAAFWHDVILGSRPSSVSFDDVTMVTDYLEKFLPKIGFTKEDTSTVVTAVKNHEFRFKPVNMEGLILQDADKLDVLSKSRWERTVGDYQSGKMSKKKITSYITTGLKWLPVIESTFHFRVSRNIAKAKISDVYEFLSKQKIIKTLGLEKEANVSQKEYLSIKTKIKRLAIRLRYFPTEFSIKFK